MEKHQESNVKAIAMLCVFAFSLAIELLSYCCFEMGPVCSITFSLLHSILFTIIGPIYVIYCLLLSFWPLQ